MGESKLLDTDALLSIAFPVVIHLGELFLNMLRLIRADANAD